MSEYDQMVGHQVNSSGNCAISGCPCRGWSAQIAAAEDSRRQREASEQPAARGGGDEREHSPLPWSDTGMHIRDARGLAIASVLSPLGKFSNAEIDANATLIIESVNQHQSLVAEREGYAQLLTAAKFLLAMNATNYDREVMRSEGGFEVLQKAVDAIEKRGAR